MVKGTVKSLRITLESTGTSVLAYVYLREVAAGQVAQTEPLGNSIMADYDVEDQLLGLEFLNAERADAAEMRRVATQLQAPELAGIDLAAMCMDKS